MRSVFRKVEPKIMSIIVLDTNIIIDHLSGKEVISFSNLSFTFSTLTVFELLQYPDLTKHEEHSIQEIVQQCIILPVTQSIAEAGAKLVRKYRVPEMDALIAATTLEVNGVLITKNVKDFRKIVGLKIQTCI